MIQSKRINGIDIKYCIADPQVDEVYAAFKLGSTIREIGQAENADTALNFNYANTVTGAPIGRLIVNNRQVSSDTIKTLRRDELYMLPDRSVHIGKAPANAMWAMQGSPRLLRSGVNDVTESIKRDQLGKDIWEGANYRVAGGLTADCKLIIVRTITKVTLHQLADIMLTLGCVDALNGDGGGSCYLWPYDLGWGRKLGAALIVKKGVEKKMFKVAIDDGHGMETAGKRTPTMPDGTVMKENEFNRRVAQLLAEHLVRCGIDVLMVAPNDVDTPLSVRTDAANKAKADLYISIHANAMTGSWGTARGIETFHYTKASANSIRAAEIIHKHLLEGTKLPDRGVKSADFHVLRETTMPAVLVECGFMDNLEEAKLLVTEAYRAECALEIAKGICEYFGVPFVEVAKPTPVVVTNPEALPAIQDRVNIVVNGKEMPQGYLIDGLTYVPIRTVSEALGATIGWDQQTKTASLMGGK